MNQLSRTIVAVAMVVSAGVAQATPISGQGGWETTLKARNISGEAVALNDSSEALFYDAALNIAWLRNANAGAGTIYGNTDIFGRSDTDGQMTWINAKTWAEASMVNAYSDWRLPTVAMAESFRSCSPWLLSSDEARRKQPGLPPRP